MKKLRRFIFCLITFLIFFLSSSISVFADATQAYCSQRAPDQNIYSCSATAGAVNYSSIQLQSSPPGFQFDTPGQPINLIYYIQTNQPDGNFHIWVPYPDFGHLGSITDHTTKADHNGFLSAQFSFNFSNGYTYQFYIARHFSSGDDSSTEVFIPFQFSYVPKNSPTPIPTSITARSCSFIVTSDDPTDPSLLKSTSKIFVNNGSFTPDLNNPPPSNGMQFSSITLLDPSGQTIPTSGNASYLTNAQGKLYFQALIADQLPVNNFAPYTVLIYDPQQQNCGVGGRGGRCSSVLDCKQNFYITDDGRQPSPTLTPSPSPTDAPECKTSCTTDKCSVPSDPCSKCSYCRKAAAAQPTANLQPLCDQIANRNDSDRSKRDLWNACHDCVVNKQGIWSAIGCIPTDPVKIVNGYVLGATGLGIAGGIAFLYFLYGAFSVLTSMGNPEKINQGKEIMTSSIAGLLLIIFSIFILRVVGVDILKIPGFSK